jgi:hypothetical protein
VISLGDHDLLPTEFAERITWFEVRAARSP